MKKGLRKMAKLVRMNTRFQRGAVEIKLDLIKGLSQFLHSIQRFPNSETVEIKLDLIKGLSRHVLQKQQVTVYVSGN